MNTTGRRIYEKKFCNNRAEGCRTGLGCTTTFFKEAVFSAGIPTGIFDLINIMDAQMELDQYECNLPASEISGAAPGTETIRLMRKPYKMTLRKERSGSRFVARTDDDKTVIELELFHDTVPALKPLSVGFELLSGTTLAQAKTLVDAMNERIVGIIVVPKD
jgi:hypothetical protein